MDDFNSRWWAPFIKALANKYYEKADHQVILYQEKFINDAIEEYVNRLKKLKMEIFGEECSADKRIDRHKTLALYLQVFSERPIFRVNDNSNLGANKKLINESYCYDFMCAVLEDWNGKRIDHQKFENYRASFFKLLYYYRDFCKHDNMDHYQTNSTFDKRINYFTYTLAHIIYFIEDNFMI
jgi:hypothetical protein